MKQVVDGGLSVNRAAQNLKQKEAQSARAESTHKGVNLRSKDVTQTQHRPKSPNSHVAYE